MEAKILIIEGDAAMLALIRQEAAAMGFMLLVARDADEMIDLAKRVHPSLIIMDIKQLSGSQKNLVLETLQRSLVTREIPLLLTHTSPDIAWQEKYHMLGVRELLMKPFDAETFQKTVKKLIREGYGPISPPERFARAFAAYNRSDMLAEQMIAKAMIAGAIHGYDEADLALVRSALSILSVAVLHQNHDEVLSLCANAMLPHDILQLIDAIEHPGDANASLVYSIVQLSQREEGGKPLFTGPVHHCDGEVLGTVRELFDSGLIRVRREEDVQLVWKEISEKILEAREYSLKEVSDFLQSALESVKSVLLRRQEAYLRLYEEDAIPRVEVFFTAEAHDNPCEGVLPKTDAVSIHYCECSPGNILEKCGMNYAQLAICLKEKTEPEAPAEPAPAIDLFDMIGSLTAAAEETESSPKKVDTISAIEFLESSSVDSEDLDTLEEIEGEITRLVDQEEDTSDHFSTILAIIGAFRKYATTIMYISEFTKMVDGLMELSGTLEGMEPGQLDEKRQKLILALLERLADDLYQWRKSIFIARDCEDIHFMDDSIIASCRQVQSFLPRAPSQESLESAAITLF